MNRKYNIQLNLSPYANVYEDGGGMVYNPDAKGFIRGNFSTDWTPQGISPNDAILSDYQQKMVNKADMKQAIAEKGDGFLNTMNSSGGGSWASAIAPAATNMINAITDTEASTAERIATAMGIPALAKIWTADNTAGDANLKAMQSNIDTFAKQNLIQDASSTFGANNAVKLNNKFIAPVPMTGVKDLSWKDFRGNMFKKGAAATLQGAAAGSVGGPWGALGGAVTGLFGSLFGGIGARSRAKKAYAEYQNKMATLTSQANSMYKQALTNQTLSNMQALANGNMSQRINDMANIRAYGGNLFDGGGDLTEEQQMVLADIQADPRILFTPKYSQWRDYIRRTSPDYLDRLYASLPYEQQQDIYQNDREAWGALSNKAKGDFGGTQVRKKTDEVSPYVAGALGLVGAAPAMEAVAMFPMLENGLNAYFGYEGAKNLPTAVTNAYDYAKKGDWSRAGLSAGEAVLDGMFLGNGIKGVKNLSELPGLSNRVNDIKNAFYDVLVDPFLQKVGEFRGYPENPSLSDTRFYTEKPIPDDVKQNFINNVRERYYRNKANDYKRRSEYLTEDLNTFKTEDHAPSFKDAYENMLSDEISNLNRLSEPNFIDNLAEGTYYEYTPVQASLHGGEFGAAHYSPQHNAVVAGTRYGGIRENGPHEIRHRMQYFSDYDKPDVLIEKAFTPTFDNAVSSKYGLSSVGASMEKETTLLDTRNKIIGDKMWSEHIPLEEQIRIIDSKTDKEILKALEDSNGYGYHYVKELKKNPKEINDVVKSLRDALKYSAVITPPVIGGLSLNNNTKAMGGNLYTDLSPNMINLWNNKQQIDQQKAMNQQFSLGLGNTAFANQFAEGGQMTSADVPENMQYYANGGTHEENPYGGIQVGTDQQGTPNLAEEGEFRWNDFVFSDRINVDANLLSSFNLAPATKHQNKKAAKGKLSYADMAKKYAKRNKELENDPITKNSMEAFMQRLANAQEYQKKAEQLEAQKQNELQDYKTALNKQNNNPMYGTMKYNGMGNAATQQGVNSGVDAGMGNPMSNADLSNVNRSGNEMMAAYGGNLFARGGNDPNPFEWTLDNLNARQVLTPWNGNFIGPTLDNNTRLGNTPNADDYSWSNIAANTPFYQNEGWGIDMKPTYMKVKNPNYNAPAVSTYATRDKNGNIIYDPNGKPFMSYPRTYEGMKSSDYPDTKVIGKTVDNYGFYLPNTLPESSVTTPVTTPEVSDNLARLNSNNYIPIASNGISPIGVPQTDSTGTTNTQITGNGDVSNKVIGKTTPNTNPDAAVPSDLSEPPLYSTAGKYAQFGKGIMPMVWDWANKTNVAYDPYQKDADRLEALANEGPALRTADTIGGYRAPNLMDVERLNNSARAEGIAQMQAILDAANGNRGYVGAHSAQNNYNTQMGIGDNHVKTQEANNTNRLQTDQFNHGINVANQNAINAMYQDNQRAEQTQHQAALSGTAQAAALRQRENLHADEVNTERMKNRATNQAAAVDNALNYFTTQAMENQELNTRNNDPTNPYWIDKYGRTHYTGDSGLTQAIRDAFGNDEYGRNGTFTGERLTEWNDLIKNKKYNAKYLKEHPELWQHLVTKQREANRIDAEKAKQAKLEELEALRGTYQSNLARLNALRDSGAIISDPSYNLYTGWADDDYSGNQGLLRTRNQALDHYITQIGNNYDRYLYEKQLAQEQAKAAKALDGYLNAGQNNNNNYYSYTRI